MGFAIPDLVIESVIRDGLAAITADLTILDDVFSELLSNYADRKYGATELQRIKDYISAHNIAVVHSFAEGAAKSPAFSIQLSNDGDKIREEALDDHLEELREEITIQSALDALKKVDPFTPTSYDPTSGQIIVDDSYDLTPVKAGNIFVDGADNEHTILSGISVTTGNKFFFIAKDATVDLGVGLIRSFITETQLEIKVAVNDTTLMIGVHTKEALLTKYFYTMLKYIFQSRKASLIKRCFDNPILKGSDFMRDLEYQGDVVYTRFLTISGRTEDTWRSDASPIIDNIEIDTELVDLD